MLNANQKYDIYMVAREIRFQEIEYFGTEIIGKLFLMILINIRRTSSQGWLRKLILELL